MIKYLIKVTIRQILKIFWVFPINSNKICFLSFRGLQPCCNPLYIYKELNKKNYGLKYVWLVNEMPEKKLANVIYVKNKTIRWFYEILTSKVIITNCGFFSYLPLRKKNCLIETWHGGGAYKKSGVFFEAKGDRGYQNLMKYLSNCLSYYISSSKKFTQIMSESAMVDENKFLPIGMPRNDIFFNNNEIKNINSKVRHELKLQPNDYIVLYAPTYRGEIKKNLFNNTLDSIAIKKTIEEKTNKNVIILFRGHNLISGNTGRSDYDMDVSSFPNMQELLCSTDMLITDYSSCMWDYSLLKRPCFLFVPDLDEYLQNRGFYTDPNTWGFPICRTNEEIQNQIKNFNKDIYLSEINKNHENFGSYENGTATEKICKIIINNIGKKNE